MPGSPVPHNRTRPFTLTEACKQAGVSRTVGFRAVLHGRLDRAIDEAGQYIRLGTTRPAAAYTADSVRSWVSDKLGGKLSSA